MRHNPPSTSAAVGTETTSDVNNSNGERKEVKKKEDGFKRIGKHSYLCPRFPKYLDKKYHGYELKRRDDNGVVTDDDLASEIVIDQFSVLLFHSLSDYKKLKSHEKKVDRRVEIPQEAPDTEIPLLIVNDNHKIKEKKLEKRHSSKKLADLSSSEKEKWRLLKAKAKAEKISIEKSFGEDTVSVAATASATQNCLLDNKLEQEQLILPAETAASPPQSITKVKSEAPNLDTDQTHENVLKRPSSSTNELTNDNAPLPSTENLPPAKIAKLSCADETASQEKRKTLIGIASTPSSLVHWPRVDMSVNGSHAHNNHDPSTLISNFILKTEQETRPTAANTSSVLTTHANLPTTSSTSNVLRIADLHQAIIRNNPVTLTYNQCLSSLNAVDPTLLQTFISPAAVAAGLPLANTPSHQDLLRSLHTPTNSKQPRQKTSFDFPIGFNSNQQAPVRKSGAVLNSMDDLRNPSNDCKNQPSISVAYPLKDHWCKTHVNIAHEIARHSDIMRRASVVGVKHNTSRDQLGGMMHKLNEAPQAQQQKAKKRSTPLSSKKRSNPQTPKTSITDVASAQSTPSLEFQKLQYNFLQQQQHKEQQYRKPNTSASVSVISSTVPKMATSLANQPDNVAPSASTQSAYEKQLLSIISSQLPSSPQKQPAPVGNLPQSMTSNSNVQRLSQLNSMNQNRSNPFQVDPSILPPSTSSVPPYLLETLALQQNFAHSMSSNSTGASMPSILAGLQKSQLNDQQIKTPTHHVKPVGGGSLTAGTSDAAAQLRRYNMGINNNIGGNLNEAQLASLLQRPNNAQQIYAQQQDLALASLIAQLATPDVNSPLGAAVNAQILAAAASDPSIFNALLNSLSVPKSAASSSNQQQTALQRQFLGTPLSHLGVGNCSFPQQQQPQQGYAPSLTDSQHGLLNGTLDPSILAAMIQQQQRLNMTSSTSELMNNYQQQQQVNMLQANALIRAMQQPQMSAPHPNQQQPNDSSSAGTTNSSSHILPPPNLPTSSKLLTAPGIGIPTSTAVDQELLIRQLHYAQLQQQLQQQQQQASGTTVNSRVSGLNPS